MTDPSNRPDDAAPTGNVTFASFQHLIHKMYFEKDARRGTDATFMWLMEEIGELASSLREGTHEEKSAEFADVIAWLVTIANIENIDLTAALRKKYGSGCPGCNQFICECPDAEKP